MTAEVQERKEKERLVASSLAEKEMLLKEVHHRVKNNLQVITSIINMQISETADPTIEDLLKTLRNRVFSMALVHERLYSNQDIAHIDMDDYLRSLVTEIAMAYQRPGLKVETRVDASGVAFAVERAMPIGLIVGEIVANSMKHAFRDRDEGTIVVTLRREGARFEMRAADDGVGPGDETASRTGSARIGGGIGVMLIEALVAQLGAQIRRKAQGGLAYIIDFPETR